MALRALSSLNSPLPRAMPVIAVASVLALGGCTDDTYPLLSSVPSTPPDVSAPEEIAGIIASLSALGESIREDTARRQGGTAGE